MRMLDGVDEPRPAASVNDLIRANEYRLRDRQSEGLGGLRVDDKLERGGLLDREVARFCSAQDLIHVGGNAPEVVPKISSITHEPARLHELPLPEHAG